MPKIYTGEEKAKFMEKILFGLSEGVTLRSMCREDDMPSWSAVYDWLEVDEELKTRFTRSREIGADAIAQEALQIADTPLMGEEYEETDDGKTKTKRGDMLGHRKLQVETRLKLLAKWFPQKYGDKLDLNHGGQPNNPINAIQIEIIKPSGE